MKKKIYTLNKLLWQENPVLFTYPSLMIWEKNMNLETDDSKMY